MVTVYSDQTVREDLTLSTYSYSLQNQILDNIASRSDLRLEVLNVQEDELWDPSYVAVNNYVAGQIPGGFGHFLRICNLSDSANKCKMDPVIFSATLDKDIFTEEIMISSELGNGSDAIYSPKKVKLFFWEGDLPDDYCRDECDTNVKFCKDDDLTKRFWKVCGEADDEDECKEFLPDLRDEDCDDGEFCVDGECVYSPCKKVECKIYESLREGCVDRIAEICNDDCDDCTGGNRCGGIKNKHFYRCLKLVDTVYSGCSENPEDRVCPDETIINAFFGFEQPNPLVSRVLNSEVPCICDEVAPVVDDDEDVTPEPEPVQKCTDGTLPGVCSSVTKPLFCNANLNLVNKCTSCGCPSGKSCNTATGACVVPCAGGTLPGACSATKPKYCNANSVLVNNCGTCGCPALTMCNAVTKTCDPLKANLVASISVTSKVGTKYYYHLQIEDLNDVGITLKRGRSCILGRVPVCTSWGISDRVVPAEGYYEGDSWWSPYNSYSDEYWLEYDDDLNDANGFITTNRLKHPF